MSTILPSGFESTQFGTPKVLHRMVSTLVQGAADDGVCDNFWDDLSNLTDGIDSTTYAYQFVCSTVGRLSNFFITAGDWEDIGPNGIINGMRIEFKVRAMYMDSIYVPNPASGPEVTFYFPIKDETYTNWETLNDQIAIPYYFPLVNNVPVESPDNVIMGSIDNDWGLAAHLGRPATGDDLIEIFPAPPPFTPPSRQAVFEVGVNSEGGGTGEVRFSEVILETFWYETQPEQIIEEFSGMFDGAVGTPTVINRQLIQSPNSILPPILNPFQVIVGVRRLYQVGAGYSGAVGEPTVLSSRIDVNSIQAGEEFGSFRVQMVVSPESISDSAIGTPHLSTPLFPVGVDETATFGNLSVWVTPLVRPAGIPSGEAFGHVGINTQMLYPDGIEPAEDFGSPSLNLTLFANNLVDLTCDNNVGTPSVVGSLSPEGFESETQFGQPTVVTRYRVVPIPIRSSLRIGVPRVTFDEQFVETSSIDQSLVSEPTIRPVTPVVVASISDGAVGVPELTHLWRIQQTTFNQENFGNPRVRSVVQPTGINETVFGTAQIVPRVTRRNVQSFVNAAVFGTIQVGSNYNIQPAGISGEVFGSVRAVRYVTQTSGIASQEAFGSPTVVPGPVVIGVFSAINPACHE